MDLGITGLHPKVAELKSAVLQVQVDLNNDKEWFKLVEIIGRLVVDWVGVIMRLILIEMIFI